MKPIDDLPHVLEAIETAVVRVWRQHRDMTNYAVLRVYEAAIVYYHALERGLTPKPVSFTGVDGTLYDAVHEACEWSLGRRPGPESIKEPIRTEDLVACLRRLKKSVDFWTKQGGRQGYLTYIQQFLR